MNDADKNAWIIETELKNYREDWARKTKQLAAIQIVVLGILLAGAAKFINWQVAGYYKEADQQRLQQNAAVLDALRKLGGKIEQAEVRP